MNTQKIASLAKYLPAAELEAVLQSLYPQDARLQPKPEPTPEQLVLVQSQVPLVSLRSGIRTGITHKWPVGTLIQRSKKPGKPFVTGSAYNDIFDWVVEALDGGIKNRTNLARDISSARGITLATVSTVISRALNDRFLKVWTPTT
jgi:hypothetical protein